jgi:hypothetical protein
VSSEVLVSLLVSLVLGDAAGQRRQTLLLRGYLQVKVLSSDDDGVGHFGGVDDTGQDSSSDRDLTGEGALLVDVGTVDGLC